MKKILNPITGQLQIVYDNLSDLTSKSYNDLTDKPTIPTNLSDLTSRSYNDLTDKPSRVLIIKPIAETTNLAITSGIGYISVPEIYNGLKISSAGGHVYTASTDGIITINIYNLTQSAYLLTTPITIDLGEKDSSTSSVVPVINSSVTLATGDELRIDVILAGTNAKGLEVRIII